MTRPIWKGHISFGLVQIPVTLFSAENRTELHFHMVDSRNNARVRFERVNETTGEEVPWDAVVKGYEYSDGGLVLLSEEDFKKADVKATQSIDLEDFVDKKDVDCIYFDKPYVLAPGKKAEKGYVLLRETLKRAGKIGIARVVIRTREYVAALMPRGDALILNLLRYHPELRDLSEFDLPKGGTEKHGVSAKELAMAEKFVDSLSSPWEPEKYKDKYRDALLKWIRQKARAGGKAAPPEAEVQEEGPAAPPVDIMELLRRSMKGSSNGHHKPAARR
jgi:DNA end-binding protein Ku